jgi:hypothetical protein
MIEATIAMAVIAQTFRPPAYPLITHDPYLSIWSSTDHPADSWPSHWTGRPHAMVSMALIDGKPFRLMGLRPEGVVPMPLKSASVTPTSTEYVFVASGVEIKMRFLSPLLPQRLEIMSRPASYITWDVRSTDRKDHRVEVYFDMTAEAAVDSVGQEVIVKKFDHKGLAGGSAATVEQPVLKKKGDDRRIDWGTLYVATRKKEVAWSGVSTADASRKSFADNRAPQFADYRGVCSEPWPVVNLRFDLKNVGPTPERRLVIVAYDDVESIQYLGENLQGFWRNEKNSGPELPVVAEKNFAKLEKECVDFDRRLMADLEKQGSKEFERIATLAYRSTIAGGKLVRDSKGNPLFFPKENTSNGCIATVDVIYPMLPQFLLLDIEVTKASLRPVLEYAGTPRWKFPFAPHDIGTYPHANGQVYGGGEQTEENQMPVEESANMIILLAAIAEIEGNAHFAKDYWPLVKKWVEYLESKGYDPENQLSTDDFAGHLAHNVNLSAKAIVALACYSKLAKSLNKIDEAEKYKAVAESFAKRWVSDATEGDHTLLAFDKPGTWSLKYNLVWDDILDLGLFPAAVKQREVEWYKRISKTYGPALDSRQNYTKLDWVVWVAAMSQNKGAFDALINPIFRMLSETKSRVPMTDWYMVDSGDYRQFIARPVVGAVFMPMLRDREVWRKWAKK